MLLSSSLSRTDLAVPAGQSTVRPVRDWGDSFVQGAGWTLHFMSHNFTSEIIHDGLLCLHRAGLGWTVSWGLALFLEQGLSDPARIRRCSRPQGAQRVDVGEVVEDKVANEGAAGTAPSSLFSLGRICNSPTSCKPRVFLEAVMAVPRLAWISLTSSVPEAMIRGAIVTAPLSGIGLDFPSPPAAPPFPPASSSSPWSHFVFPACVVSVLVFLFRSFFCFCFQTVFHRCFHLKG